VVEVVVVGAGPAGLAAAEVAAQAGHSVSVFDQRRSPARKFVLAGRGGLNLTHSEPIGQFLERYGTERVHLETAIETFGPDDLRAWCAGLGHETFVGSSGRVFPKEFRAVGLLRSWLGRLDELGVQFHFGHRWVDWRDSSLGFATADRSVDVPFDQAVLALGGASWPRVGGDGSWVELFEARSIVVTPLAAANFGVAVRWTDHMADRFAGSPLKNVAVSIGARSVRGDVVVTTTGFEGGPIYANARGVREALAASAASADSVVMLDVDLFPDLMAEALAERLASKRRPKDSISTWLGRSGFSKVAASLLREVTANALPTDPADLAKLAKAVPVPVHAVAAIDRAISTAGGVAWSEVDEHFALRAHPNVSVVGEMLDWEAPTGGYLLQACFSTGRWAVGALAK